MLRSDLKEKAISDADPRIAGIFYFFMKIVGDFTKFLKPEGILARVYIDKLYNIL